MTLLRTARRRRLLRAQGTGGSEVVIQPFQFDGELVLGATSASERGQTALIGPSGVWTHDSVNNELEAASSGGDWNRDFEFNNGVARVMSWPVLQVLDGDFTRAILINHPVATVTFRYGFYVNPSDQLSVCVVGDNIDLGSVAGAYPLVVYWTADYVFWLTEGKLRFVVENPYTATALITYFLGHSSYDQTIAGFVSQENAQDYSSDLLTDEKSGSVSIGTAITHLADCVVQWTQTTVGNGSSVLVRYTDATHHWRAAINGSGAFSLVEADGSLATRASGGTVTDGDGVTVVCDGTTITGYINNTQAWTYASASSNQTVEDGVVGLAGETGVVSDLIACVRDVANDTAGVWPAMTGVIQ